MCVFVQQEDALAQAAFEEARRRTRDFEERDRSHREDLEVRGPCEGDVYRGLYRGICHLKDKWTVTGQCSSKVRFLFKPILTSQSQPKCHNVINSHPPDSHQPLL